MIRRLALSWPNVKERFLTPFPPDTFSAFCDRAAIRRLAVNPAPGGLREVAGPLESVAERLAGHDFLVEVLGEGASRRILDRPRRSDHDVDAPTE
jgi:hypothetical protein